MIASLPMYDRPETSKANDRLWQFTREALADYAIAAPKHLTRDGDLWNIWQSPDLILSQTCGLPYRMALHDRVTLVATPIYDLPCDPGHYFSVMVAHRDDPREAPQDFNGARLAFNQSHSQSGWAAANDWARENDVRFGTVTETGAHQNAARMIADGKADIAAIDALTWKMIKHWDSFATELKEIGATSATPGLPMITAKGTDPHFLWMALCDAADALSLNDRITLGLLGYTQLSKNAYMSVPMPPAPPKPALGCPRKDPE